MSALEERVKKNLNTKRKNTELLVIEPPKSLFRVVVNNYRQEEKALHRQKEEIVETMVNDKQGLPPQPTGYIKFPEYDWF